MDCLEVRHPGIDSLSVNSLMDKENKKTDSKMECKYFEGLRLIQDGDSSVSAYLEAKDVFYFIPPDYLGSGLNSLNLKSFDYFTRRIIALEALFYYPLQIDSPNGPNL